MTKLLLSILVCGCGFAQTEFEVASVRPADGLDHGRGVTVGCSGGPGTADAGTISCENMPLISLVMRAYNVSVRELAGPEWMTEARYNIAARVPQGTTQAQVALMWQRLLTDRFKMAAHREMRETAKYDLVIGKNGSKLKPEAEDPADAPPPSRGPQKVDSEGFPELARPGMIGMDGHISLFDRKMTMERLAATIAGQVGRPVTDNTGLAGKYEVRLRWVDGNANGPTIAAALQDQLGLRLEATKGPVEFVVVDHVERTPTEN